MNNQSAAFGSCLCGAVTLKAESPAHDLGACHCSMCRNWGGGPLLTIDCQSAVSITGEESVQRYDSSEWAQRGFCKNCGTHLFYQLKSTGQYHVPIGLFEDFADVDFDHQIFIDHKPKYYAFANETKNLTGEEVFAMFAGGAEGE